MLLVDVSLNWGVADAVWHWDGVKELIFRTFAVRFM